VVRHQGQAKARTRKPGRLPQNKQVGDLLHSLQAKLDAAGGFALGGVFDRKLGVIGSGR
jgi:hypothetical protein